MGDLDEPGTDGKCLCGEDNGDGSMPVKCTNGGGGTNVGGGGSGHAMGNTGDFPGGGLGVGPVVGGLEGSEIAGGRRGRCKSGGLLGGLLSAVLGLVGLGGRGCGHEM